MYPSGRVMAPQSSGAYFRGLTEEHTPSHKKMSGKK
jgi:hypothetical protein